MGNACYKCTENVDVSVGEEDDAVACNDARKPEIRFCGDGYTVQPAPALLSERSGEEVSSEPAVMAGERRSVNDLPDEVLLKILSHFGPEDLCFLIPEVCGRWNAVSRDVTLWKTLSYSCGHTADVSRVLQVLTVAPSLHSLIIRNRRDAVCILETLFDRHVDLRKLILKRCYLGKDGSGILTKIVALYPDLETLSLEDCWPIASADCFLIARLKKLSELDVPCRNGFVGKSLHLIMDSCQHLKKLNLDGVLDMVDADVIHIINKLGKQLTTLILNKGRGLTDAAYLYLNNCARLQELGLLDCGSLTDRGLLEGIGSLKELTSLCLNSGTNLTAQALSTFLHRPAMTSIVLLDLSYCKNLDDEGLKGIAKRCLHLKELSVRCCSNVTDFGMSIVIRKCTQLHTLNLFGHNLITGFGWLALVPAHLPHLRLLSLYLCENVSSKYIAEIVAAVPGLLVINHKGDRVGTLWNKELVEDMYDEIDCIA